MQPPKRARTNKRDILVCENKKMNIILFKLKLNMGQSKVDAAIELKFIEDLYIGKIAIFK